MSLFKSGALMPHNAFVRRVGSYRLATRNSHFKISPQNFGVPGIYTDQNLIPGPVVKDSESQGKK